MPISTLDSLLTGCGVWGRGTLERRAALSGDHGLICLLIAPRIILRQPDLSEVLPNYTTLLLHNFILSLDVILDVILLDLLKYGHSFSKIR